MKKRIIALLLVTVVILSAGYVAHAAVQQRALAAKLIRLHVVANSDTEADQALKLKVRDAVLEQVNALICECGDPAAASSVLRENLPLLEQRAAQVIAAEGFEDAVSVTLELEAFPTRYYDSFTLPAGTYQSLRVCIGAAEGHNWWCVVFPSLCTAATTEELQRSAAAGNFSEEETAYISGGEEEYKLKFKALEYLQMLLDLF